MRSIRKLPRTVLLLEALGMVLLVLSYMSIHDWVHLPGMLASQQAAVGMIFLGVALMVPAAVFLVWRVVHGGSFLLLGDKPPKHDQRSLPNDDKKDQGN
ncbi:DUF1418 family protein [Serratia sp. DD3]|uniref:DUF1418 family protein n=1 Tax=Serratia sp. DD3 TaxID=1410619 RepID=UPI0003C5249D|nr:DUF1418 family protein [Serratia sp. DD3]KEY57774.1 hypothetical protein SRDD_32540 [Serratia sp. DD3]